MSLVSHVICVKFIISKVSAKITFLQYTHGRKIPTTTKKWSISILQKVDFLSLKILQFRILVPKIQQKLPNRYVVANCVTEFSYLATATSQIQCHNSRGIACLIFLDILLDYRCTVIGISILGNFHP